jgi:UDP:flavonoid glycosyltransferase YjiC (YdhE family)
VATILIWMSPEPSHILPTLKVAVDLKTRGHTVIYQTCSDLDGPLRRLGLGRYPLLSNTLDTFGTDGLYALRHAPEDWHAALARQFDGDRVRAYGAVSADLTAAASATGADLVLIDSIMGYLFGINVEVPTRVSLPVGYIQTHLPLVLSGRNMARSPRFLQRLDRTILLCPGELEIPEFYVAPERYAEASIYLDRDELEFSWEWLDPSRKLIYCSLGTQGSLYAEALDFIQAVLGAARQMPDHQFVISAGAHFRSLEESGGSPANCRILATAPQTALLERSSAMISHGGLGGLKESIYFGVPNLVAPFMNDQPLNATRVCHHGLGERTDPGTVTISLLQGAIERLLNDEELLSNVKRMQAVFRDRERAQLAATMCEELLDWRPALPA